MVSTTLENVFQRVAQPDETSENSRVKLKPVKTCNLSIRSLD